MENKDELHKWLDRNAEHYTKYINYHILPELEREKQRGLLHEVKDRHISLGVEMYPFESKFGIYTGTLNK